MLRRPLVWLLIGIASAVVGLLPWIITGMRLPFQNLWDALPAGGIPVALLPFSQYYVGLLAGMMILGSAVAGVVARLRRGPLLPIILGVALVQLVALVQTVAVVQPDLRRGTASFIYLGVIAGGIVLAMLLGILVLVLITRAPRPGLLIGATLAAIVAPHWLRALFHPGLASYGVYSDVTNMIAQYFPAIGLGVLIAWVGLRRWWVAVLALVLLWLGSTVALVGTVVAGTRVMLGRPAEIVEYAGQVWRTAIVSEGGPLWVVVVTALATFVAVAFARTIQRGVEHPPKEIAPSIENQWAGRPS